MKRLLLLAVVLVASGCGSGAQHAAAPPPPAKPNPAPRCTASASRALSSAGHAYAAVAAHGAVAYRTPGKAVVARFGPKNVNGFPTTFGLVGVRLGADCRASWYRAQLPIRPNGATGWIAARDLHVRRVPARIEIDLSRRQLTLFRGGERVFTATVAVGAPATPTPVGRYYVNQRLIPDTPDGPFGPAAIGISAFSPVLTGWAQGGPVAIHGTNEPWSIGHAVSNGCIRLPNATLSRLFKTAVAGTPVIIHP